MIGSGAAFGLRHRWLLATSTAAGVALVAVVAFSTPKTWESTATITLDPFPIGGLHGDPVDVTPAEAMAAEVAAAGGAQFREAVSQDLGRRANFRVEGDPAAASMRFTASAESSKGSFETAIDVANGYVAWGRRQQAAERVAEIQAQIDEIATRPVEPDQSSVVADLTNELATIQAALDQMPGAGGVVSDLPAPPHDPARPNLVARLLVGGLIGLTVGLAIGWLLDRRRSRSGGTIADRPSPTAHRAATGRSAVGRASLGVLVGVVSLVVAAPVLAAIVQVWELRPTTADTELTDFECLERWVDAVPDGSAVAISEESPQFFRDHLHEYVLPRLTVPGEGRPPALVLHIAAGDGAQACGGYHIDGAAP